MAGGYARASRDGLCKLYDEKYFFQPSSLFTSKDATGWLLGLRDYLSVRTAELDRLFDHIDKPSDDVSNDLGRMLQCAANEEVSKQLWACWLPSGRTTPSPCAGSETCPGTTVSGHGKR